MSNKQNSNSSVTSFVNSLIQRHNDWHNGSRKISTQELYGVLAGCLDLALSVKQNAMYADLEAELKSRNLSYTESTSVATRVVRCVFNTDERRLSSFAGVITIALRQNVDSGDFVAWINKHGGIDKVRRQFAKQKKVVLSAKELSDIAKNNLKSAPTLAVISKANLKNVTGENKAGLLLNISRINPNGDCEVIATTSDSTAIRNALASWGQYVSEQKLTTGQDNSIRQGVSALAAAVAS